MQNNTKDFITFLERFTKIHSIQKHSCGLQLGFIHQNQVKSIFFHYITPNTVADIKSLNDKWIIWEDLWIQKQDIIKASIQAMFGLNKSIHGRKTLLKSVSTPEAKVFLNENHLFSASTGKYRLGLYLDEKLVGLMSFSSGRNWKEKEGKSYEIIRFCNHKDFRVHGGFSKLLKGFISQRNPVQLMTFADASWYQSNMYEQFGFQNRHKNKTYDFWISSIHYQRKITLSDEDNEQEWMKVVNYESFKFTWES